MITKNEKKAGEILNRQFYTAIGIIVLCLWKASLFLNVAGVTKGWIYLLFGWLGPVMGILASFTTPLALLGCFAWYANIFFLFCIASLLSNMPPAFMTSTMGFALASTALAPIYSVSESDMRNHGDIEYFRGPGIWFWLGSFTVILMTSLYSRKKPLGQQP